MTIKVQVLAAIIGAAAVIIAAIITVNVKGKANPVAQIQRNSTGNLNSETKVDNNPTFHINGQVPQPPQTQDVGIVALDDAAGAPIPGAVITVTGPDGNNLVLDQIAATGRLDITKLENGNYTVTARADTYEAATQVFTPHIVTWEIRLKKIPPPTDRFPLPFAGWTPWGGLSASPRNNTITLNGAFTSAAGYVTTATGSLAGRRLILDITGTERSIFHNGQLLKLEADDQPLIPENVPILLEGEYIPAIDGGVSFIIPASFN